MSRDHWQWLWEARGPVAVSITYAEGSFNRKVPKSNTVAHRNKSELVVAGIKELLTRLNLSPLVRECSLLQERGKKLLRNPSLFSRPHRGAF